MKNKKGEVIYIGKAGNLKRRVASYFQKTHDFKTEKLVSAIKKIDYQKTDTAVEALILESRLIKKYRPKYNIRETDDKSFLYVEITKEKFPRVLLTREKDLDKKSKSKFYGPFTSTGNLREALKIIRKIFRYSTHTYNEIKKGHPCFNYQIGLCPGNCCGAIIQREYKKSIRNVKLFFNGKKKNILNFLERDMKLASREERFEDAERAKQQIFSLKHIQDIALLKNDEIATGDKIEKMRIEGYDISNISGTSAVGAMVVFIGNNPSKNEYRKFKIRMVKKIDDTGMLREIITRRLKNNWPLPNLFLIDGGKAQVNVAKGVLDTNGLKIPIVGIAKGPTRKKNEFVGKVPEGIEEKTLIKVRDEAHRFAISYHKTVRSKKFIN